MTTKIGLAKTCEFLLYDSPLVLEKNHKKILPAINHTLAYNYAKAVEPLLNFNYPDRDAKIPSLLYHRLVAHTAKHLIHKYKRFPNGYFQYKIWAISDFDAEEGQKFSYVEYPRFFDLVALKREVCARTPIKIKNLDLDNALDSLNTGANNDFIEYDMLQFHKDFELVNFFWEIMINYMKVAKEKEAENIEDLTNTTKKIN